MTEFPTSDESAEEVALAKSPAFQAQIRIWHLSPTGLTKETTDMQTTIQATVRGGQGTTLGVRRS